MLSRIERAEQFLPFDAVKGLQFALREKENLCMNKVELSDEQIENISNLLGVMKIGDSIEVVYYDNKQYKKIQGKVTKISNVKKSIAIDNVEVFFIDIFSINREY